MSRNVDPVLAGNLPAKDIQQLILAAITLKSGVEYVWSGVGDLVWNGQTFSGLGEFASMGPIAEGSAVKADGTTITLSGIGLSQIGPPTLNIPPPTPPVPVPPGQTLGWAYPQAGGPTQLTFGNGGTGFLDPCTGSASAFPASQGSAPNGGCAYTVSRGLGQTVNGMVWGAFVVDGGLPLNPVIHAIYPVIVANYTQDIGVAHLAYGTGFQTDSLVGTTSTDFLGYDGHASFIDQYTGPSLGSSLDVLASANIGAWINTTLFKNNCADVLGVGNAALAVYYDTAPPAPSTLLHEALNDIQLGAPVKIWYGHWLNGGLLGTPYLIFAGLVDKPTVDVSDKSSAITLALENRLVNLQRPNERRYTAADQRLYYPTDTGFNWVEILNDIALRWGN